MKYIYPLICFFFCAAAVYFRQQWSNMKVAYNRADREYVQLYADYEKLYTAYYTYEEKLKIVLSVVPNVYWAEDSSAYIIQRGEEFLFSFYKKPVMEKEYHLFRDENMISTVFAYADLGRVDTLKPHQFFHCKNTRIYKERWRVAGMKNEKEIDANDIKSEIWVE